jgi:uncharacterized membrane protein
MNILTTIFWAALLSFIPISELRGGIPFAIANGMPWYWAWCLGVFTNALVAPFCWIFLSTFHKLFLNMKWYESFFNKFIERARNKLHGGIEKWGWFGVAIFVAIPFPLTGAWTGTLGAWVLGLSKKKTLLAVIIGVMISGSIVTSVMVFGAKAFDMFIKHV